MPIAYLPHFVPAVEIAPLSGDAPAYFLFVGRLEKLKGLQTIIPLFRHYPRAQLWIAGTGQYEGELHELAAGSANISSSAINRAPRLQELYRQAIAVVVPSMNMRSRRRSSSWRRTDSRRRRSSAISGSMPEIIADSGAGFVYDDLNDLRDKMDGLCANRTMRDEPRHARISGVSDKVDGRRASGGVLLADP